VLEDEQFFDAFILENQRRLREAYEYLTGWFKFHHVPYLPSNAGHFVMADFRPFFASSDESGSSLTTVEEDGGKARDQHLIKRCIAAKVFVGSAQAFSYPVPGWVRITFAMRRDYLVEGLGRLEKVFGLPRWEGLDEAVPAAPKAQKAELGGGEQHVKEVSERLEKTAL
jgi:aspartate/methionine/tyrosine aminotransferase